MKCPKCKQEVPAEALALLARTSQGACPSCGVRLQLNRPARKATLPLDPAAGAAPAPAARPAQPAPASPAGPAQPAVRSPKSPPTSSGSPAASSPGWLAQYLDELAPESPRAGARRARLAISKPAELLPPVTPPKPAAHEAPRLAKPEPTVAKPQPPSVTRPQPPSVAEPPPPAAEPEPPAEPPPAPWVEPPTLADTEPPTLAEPWPPPEPEAAPASAPAVVPQAPPVETPPPSRLSAMSAELAAPVVTVLDAARRRRHVLMAGAAGLIGALSIAAAFRSPRPDPGPPLEASRPRPAATAVSPESPATAAAPPPTRERTARRKRAAPPAPRTAATAAPAPRTAAKAPTRPSSGSAAAPTSTPTPRPVQNEPPRSPAAAADAYRRGNERLLAGDTATASQAFRQAISLDPTLAAAHRGLGLAEAQLGNRRASVRSLRRYLQLAPAAPDKEPIRARIRLLTSGS